MIKRFIISVLFILTVGAIHELPLYAGLDSGFWFDSVKLRRVGNIDLMKKGLPPPSAGVFIS